MDRGQRYMREETYAQTRLPVERATTLVPEAYTSSEFFELEQENVFARSWIAVGYTSHLQEPRRALVTSVAGRSVIVLRDEEGELQAFHNVCRHRGTKLLDDGRRRLSSRIRCPYHSWTYDLRGTCVGTPLFEGSDIPEDQQAVFDMSEVKGFDRADYGLLPVSVDSWGFLVFVNLDPRAAPLARQLGDLPDRFSDYRLDEWQVVREKPYRVSANYKLAAENFMECYHLPWVHPELVKVSRVENHFRWQGPGLYTGMCTTPISENTDEGGWQGLPPLRGLDPEDAASGRFVLLFPNTAVSILPNHAFVIRAIPVGPADTLEETTILCHPESLASPDADEGLDRLESFWDLVNAQDIEIVERVQLGVSNPAYRGGRMCYRFEEPIHRYQNIVIDKMVGIDRVPAGDDEPMQPMFVAPADEASRGA